MRQSPFSGPRNATQRVPYSQFGKSLGIKAAKFALSREAARYGSLRRVSGKM
jgi:hypothetical protein